MGIHAYIKELNPIVLYTFDPQYSFLNTESCTGFYINSTEFEFPPLELKNSGIYIKEPFLKFITPALSYIENNSLKKSFSTSNGLTIYGSYPLDNGSKENYSFNNGSLYAEVDLSDNLDFIVNSYTIFFQLKVSSLLADVTYKQPYILYTENLSGLTNFGLFSRCSFYDGKLFDEDIIISSGHSSYVLNYDEEIRSDLSYGYFSTCNLSYNPANMYTNVIINDPLSIFYNRTYFSTDMTDLYFKFRNIELNILQDGYIVTDPLSSSEIGIPLDKVINVFLEYDSVTSQTLIYIDKAAPVIIKTDYAFTNNILKLGYESKLRRSYVPGYEAINTNIADTPKLNVSFDNLSIYPRKLTNQEKDRLYDINRDFPDRFAEYGYNQLYLFDDLYDIVSRKYIENETMLTNKLGASYLYVKCSKNSDLPYIYRQNDVEIEYVYHNTKYSCISTNRNPNNSYPISMIRNDTRTVSFRFNTTDLDGALFSCGLYEHDPNNIGLLMDSGNLQIWIGAELKSTVTGIANGEWHSAHIVFNDSTTRIYIDNEVYFSVTTLIKPSQNTMTLFGSIIPGNSLECDYALIGASNVALSLYKISTLKQNTSLYSAMGQITINNVPIGTSIYVYDRSTGILIDTIISSSLDGTFKYVNKTPYVLTIIVSDSGYLNGRAYIVDPIEIK